MNGFPSPMRQLTEEKGARSFLPEASAGKAYPNLVPIHICAVSKPPCTDALWANGDECIIGVRERFLCDGQESLSAFGAGHRVQCDENGAFWWRQSLLEQQAAKTCIFGDENQVIRACIVEDNCIDRTRKDVPDENDLGVLRKRRDRQELIDAFVEQDLATRSDAHAATTPSFSTKSAA